MTTTIQPATAARCELAGSRESLDLAYRLRYECYQRRGAIPFNSEQRLDRKSVV